LALDDMVSPEGVASTLTIPSGQRLVVTSVNMAVFVSPGGTPAVNVDRSAGFGPQSIVDTVWFPVAPALSQASQVTLSYPTGIAFGAGTQRCVSTLSLDNTVTINTASAHGYLTSQ
jgi:hypothetical protein